MKSVGLVHTWLLIILLVAIPVKAERRITIFGDSLSASSHSWAEKLRSPDVHIRNYAWEGLLLRDFTVPRWLTCFRFYGLPADQVVLWFGVNDAVLGSSIGYGVRLRDALQVLEGRGCRVYLMLPPLYIDRLATHNALIRIRRTAYRLAREYDNVQVIEPYWDTALTRDGLHPTDALHELLAEQMGELLGATP